MNPVEKRTSRAFSENVPVGKFGVDSGQIIIVDPCYLNEWLHNRMDEESAEELSWSNVCRTTLDEEFQIGHSCAVVSTTGHGDGLYPVYADFDEAGAVKELRIRFLR